MSGFIPTNELERSLVSAMNGRLSEAALLDAFLASDVVVLLDQPPANDGQLGTAQPLGYRMTDGNNGVAIFTSVDRAPKDDNEYDHALQTKFSWILSIMTDGVGMVVNPGHTCGFELPPFGVAKLKAMVEGGSTAT